MNFIFCIHKIYFSEKGRKDLERKRSSADEHSNDAQLTAARDMEEARQRVLNALKTSFAKQRNDGLISDDAVTVLNQAVNSVQNENQSGQFVSLNQLKRNWKLFGFLPKVNFHNVSDSIPHGSNVVLLYRKQSFIRALFSCFI